AGIRPSASVIVATVRALKFHGGVEVPDLKTENVEALIRGMANLERHVDNMRDTFGIPVVVAINHRAEDTDAEVQALIERGEHHGVKVILSKHFAEGGEGAVDLAHEVVKLCEQPNYLKFVYEDDTPLWDKMKAIATKIYGASDITADTKVRTQIKQLQDTGYGKFPVCVAKTQYSFSTDPKLRGAPSDHVVNIREVRLAAGAEFIVMICGDIMTMPGLPRVPAANSIDVDETGKIVGLF
ncbi:MAG: formate--tetrahydrofolate ligase, partial [Sphingomonadales bacterium]